jgi:hypothetical protein
MAITNYSELQTAIADFLNRDDLTAVIPTFIQLAEAQISRELRHWRQQRRVTTTVDEQFENLPSDFIEAVHFYIDGQYGEKTLEFASMAEISRRKQVLNGQGGEPVVYTLNSGQIEFVPIPDENYDLTMIYYAKLPQLSDTDVDNWVLDLYPDMYLYGSLMHSAPYLQEDARTGTWAQLYAAAVQNANEDSGNAMYSGSPLVMRNK